MTRCLLPLCMSVAQAGSVTAGDATTAFQQKGAAAGWAVRETSLGPAGDKVVVSPDRRHVAHVVRRGDKEVVLRDRTESPEYESVKGVSTSLLFSPDSRRLAYVAKREGSWRLVIDGQEVAAVKVGGSIMSGNQYVVSVWFSHPNGDRWFAWATNRGFFEGQKQPLDQLPNCISKDGVRFAFIRDSHTERRELVVHGPQGIEFRREVGPPTRVKFDSGCPFSGCEFSPDGQRLVYSVILHTVHAVGELFGRESGSRS